MTSILHVLGGQNHNATVPSPTDLFKQGVEAFTTQHCTDSKCPCAVRLSVAVVVQVRARLAAKKKAADAKKKSLAAIAAAEAKARAKKSGAKKDPTKFNQAPTR